MTKDWYEITRYALAPMYAESYPQWLGIILGYPNDQAMNGVMTTGGTWANAGPVDACKQGFLSMLTAEMSQHQYVVVTQDAVNQLDHLQKWMTQQAIALFPLGETTKSLAHSNVTMLTLPPEIGVADLTLPDDGMTAEAVALWKQGTTTISPAAYGHVTLGTTTISPAAYGHVTLNWDVETSTLSYVQKPEPPTPPKLIETELVPDVACSASRCAHRLTSHVQNKPGESGPCVIPGCTCEQWRNVCAGCGGVSYPWRHTHTAACQSGQRMRQVLADRRELEQSEKRNRRARTSIEQIPEVF